MNLAPILRRVRGWARDTLADSIDAQHRMAARRLAVDSYSPNPDSAPGRYREFLLRTPIHCSTTRPRASGRPTVPSPEATLASHRAPTACRAAVSPAGPDRSAAVRRRG